MVVSRFQNQFVQSYISCCETHRRGPSWLTENFMLIVLCSLSPWLEGRFFFFSPLPSFFLSISFFFLLPIESSHGRFNYKRQGRFLLSSFPFLRRNELYRHAHACLSRVCTYIYIYTHAWTWLPDCVHTFISCYSSEAWKMFRIFLKLCKTPLT